MQVWGAQTAAHKWGDPAGAELLAQVVVGCAQRWNLPSLEFIRYFYLNRHSRGLLANSTTGSFSLELPCCLESHVANLNTVLFCRGGVCWSLRGGGGEDAHPCPKLDLASKSCWGYKLNGRTGDQCSALVAFISAPPKDPGSPPGCCKSCRDAKPAPHNASVGATTGARPATLSLEILLAFLAP